MNKKICILGKFPPYLGGISTYNYKLAKEIMKNNILLPIGYKRFYPRIISHKLEKDKNYNINCDKEFFGLVKNLFKPYNPLTWFKTINLIRKFNPDLVILPWWFIYLAPAYLFILNKLNKINIKALIICHNVLLENKPNDAKSILIKNLIFRKCLVRKVFLQTKYFVAPSSREINQILSFNKNALILKNLCPIFEFPKGNYTKEENNRDLNLLFFGYIRKSKGLDILLDAISLLSDYNINLTIAGKVLRKNEKDFHINKIKENGIENFVSYNDRYMSEKEIERYFINSDVVVLPYKEGTSSGVIATSYGFGKPVLVTNVGGLPEAVEDKKTGLIVEYADANYVADGIKWFIKNKNQDFKKNINQFVRNYMSFQSLVKKIISII